MNVTENIREDCLLTEHQVSCAMAMAYNTARFSPDLSTQNGAVIVEQKTGRGVGAGCNRPPDGVALRPNRPEKYLFTEHAERMAIFNALVANGRDLSDCVMVCAWAACADCARAIVLSGLKVLVRHVPKHNYANDRWDVSVTAGDVIMHEGGVKVINWDGPLDGLRAGLILRKDGYDYDPYQLWKGPR